MALGVVPSISLVLGASFAGTAYSPMMADAFIMCDRPYCFMALSSPSLLKTVTFVDVTYPEIGGARIHAEISGSCDYFGKDEEDAIAATREYLTYFPSNCREKPPFKDTGDDPKRRDDALIDIIPSDLRQPYDMHEVILRLVDNARFLELKKEYAKNIIVGLARMGGHSVGIVANNPAVLDGAMDLRSAEKQARFIRTCDCFNIPLIFLVDTPGFVVDPEQERMGLVRHAAMVMYAICEATVPKITIYLRRCYKEGYHAMGTRLMGNDMLFAWPGAQIQLVEFNKAVETVYEKPVEEIAPGKLADFSKKYFDSPYHAGALLMLDDIINPRDTRPVLIDALQIIASKEVVRPEKKHGNIPL
jgi:acetyl-CoA carboxylase carboxyltransferase component